MGKRIESFVEKLKKKKLKTKMIKIECLFCISLSFGLALSKINVGINSTDYRRFIRLFVRMHHIM